MPPSAKEQQHSEFFWSKLEEPHVIRRREILAKYPQIKELYGYDHTAVYKVLAMVGVQFLGMYLARDAPWGWLWFFTYAVSGTLNHSLSLAVHELSHGLMFKNGFYNLLLGYLCNLPQGVPSSQTFKRYHMEHHLYQGVDAIDTDIPTELEAKFFTSVPRKILFLILQPLCYALRPMIVNPKPPRKMELLNTAIQITFDVLVVYFLGWKSFFYCLVGTLLGMGLHPCAGHFIAEHYVFTEGQETYSYYGPLNMLCFNVGYHNEHHDFPRIPGSRLPEVKRIAPEYYDTLPQYSSWTKVLWDFVFEDRMGGYSRMKRNKRTMSKSSLD